MVENHPRHFHDARVIILDGQPDRLNSTRQKTLFGS
jgi:hypothetical protein